VVPGAGVPARHDVTARLVLDGLALVYLAAFLSMAVQITGLVGRSGLLPLADYLHAVAQAHPGAERYWLYPTLFWIRASDKLLATACWTGAAASLSMIWRGGPRWLHGVLLAIAFVLWLSIFYAGQVFTDFQWDLLLLEAGFLALAFHRHPTLMIWLVRWLMFRFMLMSGWVKFTGDSAWLDLSALRRHFETQPLPSPLAWTASQLPQGLLSAATFATLAIELLLPFFIWLPRRLRFAAAGLFIAFQFAIAATGNYGWFNLLVVVLCLGLFDDAAIRSWMPARLHQRPAGHAGERRTPSLGLATLAGACVVLGLLQLVETWRSPAPSHAYARALDTLGTLHVVNRYGPFRILSAERVEIVIEASDDGRAWREIEFRYKPGAPGRPPGWNLPHQPRLDWQMWFAAMGTQRENPWFARLLLRVLQGSPEVAALLAPSHGRPPHFIRAVAYDYRFASPPERARGDWWTRRQIGLYFPAVRLGKAAAGEGELAPMDGP